MKFLLNSSIDTLPTKVNLKQWGKVSSDKCFCGKKQTLNHILSCCKKMLDQGRYTYRHDNILNYISSCLDVEKFKCFVDLEGSQTSARGTIPPNIMVTNLKPDIVVVDKSKKEVSIFELTCPAETRIDISNKLKSEKYAHFETDITAYKASVIPFEVGAHTGYISNRNKDNIKRLHTFCKKGIKLKQFSNNISAICGMGSYYIFNCRNEHNWENIDPITAPFSNN